MVYEEISREEKIKALEANCVCGRWKYIHVGNEPVCVDKEHPEVMCSTDRLAKNNPRESPTYGCHFKGANDAFINDAYVRLMKMIETESTKQ